ncbi:MAG: hypothetical protein IJO76_00760 [Clostridia bacterium]|nr:hypothetical protein [Clostridia bacterium]
MKAYRHYVDPKKYPRYEKRAAKAVTYDTMDNKVQFSASRFVTVDPATGRMVCIDNELDRYTVQHEIGRCFWLNWKDFLSENVDELIDAVRDRGLYLYGAWGYEPGAEANLATNTWGEFSVSERVHNRLMAELGDRFFGYEMGEQDGRYIGAFVSREDAAVHPKTRVEQCKNFERWHSRIAADSHNCMTVLCSSALVHYYARSGYATLLSCEAAQALPNPQMWYAFIRGASKQYGLLTSGNVSVWNLNSYKTYGPEFVPDAGERGSADSGTSLSLMRRILWNEYMYNCVFLGYENGWFCNDDSERHVLGLVTPEMAAQPGEISPIGEVQQYANRLINKLGYPGVMYTPVAVMTDTFAGWNPPRFLYTPKLYEVWGSIPYGAGDHQLHALFSMLYPGYENAGFYEDESGFLTATPYGELTDVLLSDADGAVLRRYPLMLVTNGTGITLEVYDKLRRFTEEGGHLVVCASALLQAAQTLSAYDEDYLTYFGLEQTGKTRSVSGFALYGGNTYPVKDLRLLSATLTADAVVEAMVEGQPALYTVTRGAGRVTVLLTEDGLEVADENPTPANLRNNPITRPYDLTPFVKAYLGDLYDRLALVKPTNRDLQYMVTVKEENTFMLQVVNNTYAAQKYDLTSPLGLSAAQRIPMEDGADKAVGYYPACVTVSDDPIGEGAYTIAAGDVHLYTVTTDCGVELQAESNPAPTPSVGVKMPIGSRSIQDFLLETPSFDQYFDAVLVDATYVERTDLETVKKEADYLRRVGIKVAVDLTRLMNWFPDLSFHEKYPKILAESYKRLDLILEKVVQYPLEAVVVSTTPGPEHLRDYLPAVYRYIGEKLAGTEAILICRNRGLTMPIATQYKAAVDTDGVELGWCTSAGISLRHNSPHTPEEIGEDFPLRHLFLSAPTRTAAGNRQNGYAPIVGSGFEAEVAHSLSVVTDGLVYLAADYADWNEIYADYRLLF